MTKHGSWVMEDWLHFTETYSLYLLCDNLLNPTERRMWELLRAATVFCFRAGERGASLQHGGVREAGHDRLA